MAVRLEWHGGNDIFGLGDLCRMTSGEDSGSAALGSDSG
jgi:hypothetical protein